MRNNFLAEQSRAAVRLPFSHIIVLTTTYVISIKYKTILCVIEEISQKMVFLCEKIFL